MTRHFLRDDDLSHDEQRDILDLAEACEFEEIAHLLIHGKLPNRAELTAYKAKLKALRGLPKNPSSTKSTSVMPSSSSMAINGRPPCSPMSNTVQMLR